MREVTYNALATIKEEPYEKALHVALATVIESLEIEEDEVLITIEEKRDSNYAKYAEFTVDLGEGMTESGEMRIDQMAHMVLVDTIHSDDGMRHITAVDIETGYPYYFM